MSQEIVSQQTPQGSEMLVASSQQAQTLTQRLLLRLPDMEDAELLDCARFAEELGKSAFLIRGAVAAEIRRRYPSLSGRRQVTQQEGRKALLRQLDQQHSLSLRVIEEDATIYTTFVLCGEGKGESVSAHTFLPLARDFYRFALQAPDPHAGIRHALREKQADPSYSTRAFREYVCSLRPAKTKKTVEAFRKEGKELSLSVKAGEETDRQVVLAFMKQAVLDFEEQLKREAEDTEEPAAREAQGLRRPFSENNL